MIRELMAEVAPDERGPIAHVAAAYWQAIAYCHRHLPFASAVGLCKSVLEA
jgi:hypothetical protein